MISSDQLKLLKKQMDPTRKYTFGIFQSTQTHAGKKVQNFKLTKIIDSKGDPLQDSSTCVLHKLPMKRGVATIEDGYDYPDRVDVAEKRFPNNGVINAIDSSYDSTLTTVWIVLLSQHKFTPCWRLQTSTMFTHSELDKTPNPFGSCRSNP